MAEEKPAELAPETSNPQTSNTETLTPQASNSVTSAPDASNTETPGSEEQSAEPRERKKRPKLRWIIAAIVVAALVATGVYFAFFHGEKFEEINTSEGVVLLEGDTVERAEITDGAQQVKLWLSKPTSTRDEKGKSHEVGTRVTFNYVAPQAKQIAELVDEAKLKDGYNSKVPQESIWSSIAMVSIPMLIVVAFFYFAMNQFQAFSSLSKVRDRGAKEGEKPDVTFKDVAGEDEAVEELREVTAFLAHPERFAALGAKIPRGVLLYGPPGTGKTLLAKAVAGEAGVRFYSISASEFVEMYVGVGASRVRSLFRKARENAPAIVFVDEIDAVGRGRGNGIGGGNDEREQTLNQLLVELDGFDERAQVILVAATNRPDVLDPALLRPGRFDRHIAVDAPDVAGREAILKIHAEGKPLAEGVDLGEIARRTPGFTGADLANTMNEAALLAARRELDAISAHELEEAIDRVIAGPQRASRVMSEDDKKMTAYHEAGHALAAAASHHADPVTKVTILPRGQALGYTMTLPTQERYSTSRNQLLDQLTYAMGGRAAEELIFGDPSTGASNDIQKATRIATRMVEEFGMSQAVGLMRVAREDSDPFTRGAGEGASSHSDRLRHGVDEEVRALLDAAYAEAYTLLETNRAVLDRLAERLLEKETVLEAELKEIFADVTKLPAREPWAFKVEGSQTTLTKGGEA